MQGRFDACLERDSPELVVELEILVYALQHHLALGFCEVQPGELFCGFQYLHRDLLHLRVLHLGPQDAGQQSGRQSEARKVLDELTPSVQNEDCS